MILLLDNYDSFVHNLARYFRCLGCQTEVVRSDAIDADGCGQMNPEAIVLSPGPLRPEQAGCSIDIVRNMSPEVPILGVCLGHQAIGVALGGRVIQCDPVHGTASQITHDRSGLFSDLPSPIEVGRYHALAIDPDSLPQALEVNARTSDGIIMGIRHRQRPIYGVQFHPESILTQQGEQLISNFVAIVRKAREGLVL